MICKAMTDVAIAAKGRLKNVMGNRSEP